MLLGHEVTVRSVHPCTLVKFKSANASETNKKIFKSADNADAAKADEEEDKASDYDSDDDKWQCNGVVCFPDGCKSGQVDF